MSTEQIPLGPPSYSSAFFAFLFFIFPIYNQEFLTFIANTLKMNDSSSLLHPLTIIKIPASGKCLSSSVFSLLNPASSHFPLISPFARKSKLGKDF